jgi:hypothetical protein
MEISDILLLIALIIIIVFSSNLTETFAETFMPDQTQVYLDACKKLVNDSVNVDTLATSYCGPNAHTPNESNRDNINISTSCRDQVEKQIMIVHEVPSYCSRTVPKDRLAQSIELLRAPSSAPTLQSLEGPQFMQNQYDVQDDLSTYAAA